MSDANIVFGATDLLGLSDSVTNTEFGDQRFIAQSSTDDDQGSYAIVQDVNGDELLRSAQFDNKNEVSQTYRWNAVTGLGAALPKIGHITGGYMITGWTVSSTNDDFPTIEVTAHKHDTSSHDTTAHLACRYALPDTFAELITGAFGAYDILVASNDTSGAAVANSSITLECEHVDVNRADGEHLAGENYNGKVTTSVTYNGLPNEVDTRSSWHITSISSSRENTAFQTVTYNAEKGLTQDTAEL